MNGEWVQYAVYKRPSDLPDWPYVVRPWAIGAGRLVPGKIVCLCRNRTEVFAGLDRPGLAWVPRQPNDDPVVVGVFL